MNFSNSDVIEVFDNYPEDIRNKLLDIRKIIFQTAEKHKEIGETEESLKWGEPSYLPCLKNIGTTVRSQVCLSSF